MDGFVDIYTIIFLILAIVIFLRLRSVLGRRTGNERPPFDPFSARRAPPAQAGDKVIALPRRGGRAPEISAGRAQEIEEKIRSVAPEGSALAEGLKNVIAVDPGFDPENFLSGARKAYEMVVTAFADGDRKALKQLLSREVYDGFVGAIAEREAREERVEHSFVGINKAEITEAATKGGLAHVTVRFVSSLISATRDKEGVVVDGDPTHVSEVTDVWTFAREVSSRDPNWKLVATESVE
jgi:predicted lipid-binding transport protein (Tim44 family)